MPVKAYSRYKRHIELAYVEDWLYTFHRDKITMTNVPIGPDVKIEDGKIVYTAEEGLKSTRRPRCDAVVITQGEIWIVEAAVLPHRYTKALGDLLMYKGIAHLTPEFREYMPRSIRFKLLTPLKHPKVWEECLRNDIENIVWMPPITAEYLRSLLPYLRSIPPVYSSELLQA